MAIVVLLGHRYGKWFANKSLYEERERHRVEVEEINQKYAREYESLSEQHQRDLKLVKEQNKRDLETVESKHKDWAEEVRIVVEDLERGSELAAKKLANLQERIESLDRDIQNLAEEHVSKSKADDEQKRIFAEFKAKLERVRKMNTRSVN